jgi:hypothetical protein
MALTQALGLDPQHEGAQKIEKEWDLIPLLIVFW